nr:hypothetical protein StreXyl84_79380 [Streptomyces sp. Xyl84]
MRLVTRFLRHPGNARMRRAVLGLDRLGDLEEVLREERQRARGAP